MIITIDGPIATGKSSVAKRLAERLGFIFFDTGAMYRVVTYGIMKHQVDWEYGDWHARVSATGKPSGDKAGVWKSPYHNGRAMLQCLRLLSFLDEICPSAIPLLLLTVMEADWQRSLDGPY